MADIKITDMTEDLSPPPSGYLEMAVPTPSGYYSRKVKFSNLPSSGSGGDNKKWIDASEMVSNSTNGATAGTMEMSTNKNMYDYYSFDASTEQAVQFKTTPHSSWNNSTVKITFYWTAPSGSGDVVWGAQAVAESNDDVLDVAFGTAQTVTDTLISADDLHVSSQTANISVGGSPASGDMVVFRFYRDADNGSDTFSASARLLGVLLEWNLS